MKIHLLILPSNDGGTAKYVSIGPDDKIYLANESDGLSVYSYNGFSFTGVAHLNENSNIECVTVGMDGTIFLTYTLSDHTHGLKAYTFDGNVFTNTASLNILGNGIGMIADLTNNIFLASYRNGLNSYSYKVAVNVDEATSINDMFYSLSQNYPNPFNPNTTISYTLLQSGLVKLKVYDILGKEMAVLVNEEQSTGNHKIEFNGTNLPSGVYFYRLTTGDFTDTKKLILLK